MPRNQISGANIASAGIGNKATRAAPRPAVTSAASQRTTRAGASEGAQATTPLRQGRQEGRCESPQGGGGDAEPGTLGQSRRGEPSAERRQGEGQYPEHDEGHGRVPGGEAAQNRHDRREGICGSDDAEAQLTATVRSITPEPRERRREGKQSPALHAGPGEQREEGDRTDHEGRQHRPGATATAPTRAQARALARHSPRTEPGDLRIRCRTVRAAASGRMLSQINGTSPGSA